MDDTLGNGHSFSCHPNPSSLVERHCGIWNKRSRGTEYTQRPVPLEGRTEVQDLDESCLNHSNLGLASEPKKLNWAFRPLPLR